MKIPNPRETPVVGVKGAADLFGVSANAVYRHLKRGDWPTPVIRCGNRYRFPVAPMLKLLGLEADDPA